MEQRTPEWFAARLGKVTGSRFKDAIDVTSKGAPSSKRKDYLIQIATERLTGMQVPMFVTGDMQWGTDHEDEARDAYCFLHDQEVMQAGFIPHPELMVGVSPDGLIGDDGAIEIKAPKSTTHIETWLNGMSPDHLPQVQGLMWVTGRKFVDFISYDPRMPEHLRLYVQRIERDEAYIAKLEAGIRQFLDEVDAFINKLPRAA
jgi:hypothetical protein